MKFLCLVFYNFNDDQYRSVNGLIKQKALKKSPYIALKNEL